MVNSLAYTVGTQQICRFYLVIWQLVYFVFLQIHARTMANNIEHTERVLAMQDAARTQAICSADCSDQMTHYDEDSPHINVDLINVNTQKGVTTFLTERRKLKVEQLT